MITCKHCGEEIEPIDYFYRGRPAAEVKHGWHHVKATDNSDGKYITSCDINNSDLEAEPGGLSEPHASDCAAWVGESCDCVIGKAA